MSAIERIQGFACEVNQEQWEELVRVADSVGVQICDNLMIGNSKMRIEYSYVGGEGGKILVGWKARPLFIDNLIPYPDFLSKLKGEEKWEPKNGEEVEVSQSGDKWLTHQYVIAHNDGHVVYRELNCTYLWFPMCRPLRPTITRQEAESILNKRIID
jgi:hypothetical protein